jgi:predicted nucleotidyltransferase
MHSVISERRSEISELCKKYDVLKLEVFGSAARGGDFDVARSDADFLVAFKMKERNGSALEQYFGLRNSLAEIVGRPVDLIETNAIRNPYRLQLINRERQLVYAA